MRSTFVRSLRRVVGLPAIGALLLSAIVLLPMACGTPPPGEPVPEGGDQDAAASVTDTVAAAATPVYTETDLVSGVRQLIFEGERSGEGYFDASGTRMIYQAEREPDNPFYQMYILDLETGDTERVSTGVGKTTCAWFHPSGEKVLFASTHEDPRARELMQELIDLRARGEAPRYSFEYDDTYEIYEVVPGTTDYVNLTNSPGYDAEGSWSPDGSKIVFTSNRLAYTEPMSDEDQELFDLDPAYMADLYIMNADGSDVQRLTDHKGYDGGPFFSPDGERIIWRSFTPDGVLAEIWTMNIDGSDKKQLTELDAMSWAPYYHPSGDYAVFATNLHGFANFELYMVDIEGEKEPVRVTFTDGPDVLPVFTPDGTQLAWVTRRTDGKPQIHIGAWDDAKARELLSLSPERGAVTYGADAGVMAAADMGATDAEVRAEDARLHVERLASDEMEGRLAGTPGEAKATAYVAQAFEAIGLAPEGTDGYFQPFDFTSGVALAGTNVLSVEKPDGTKVEPELDAVWRPIAFSKTGSVGFSEVAFAGYGIVAPEDGDQAAYDSYGDLDVEGKWVLVLRYVPEDVTPERRQHLSRYASLRYKAMEARDRGAVGLLVASGPSSQVQEELVPLAFDGVVAGASIPAASVSDALADDLLAGSGSTLAELQAALDAGDEAPGLALEDVTVGAHIELEVEEAVARNVLGRLMIGDAPTDEVVVVGAHVDHLGRGEGGDSLAKADEKGQVHYGADDNASGVAALIEIAQLLADRAADGELQDADRDLVFAAWSAEELGLLGSEHYAEALLDGEESLQGRVAAYLNMDMVGRLDEAVVLQGVASSPWWKSQIEKRNVVVGLPVKLSEDTYLPTDGTSFYLKGVPILSAFTGAHAEYHSPRDTADTLDYDGLAQIARLMAMLAEDAAEVDAPPEYVKVEGRPNRDSGRTGRVYLGTIPDYGSMNDEAEGTTGGVLLAGVSANSPASEGGVAAGDIVVMLAGQEIGNVFDYTRVLDSLKIGEPAEIVVLRDGERVTLTVVPASRE